MNRLDDCADSGHRIALFTHLYADTRFDFYGYLLFGSGPIPFKSLKQAVSTTLWIYRIALSTSALVTVALNWLALLLIWDNADMRWDLFFILLVAALLIVQLYVSFCVKRDMMRIVREGRKYKYSLYLRHLEGTVYQWLGLTRITFFGNSPKHSPIILLHFDAEVMMSRPIVYREQRRPEHTDLTIYNPRWRGLLGFIIPNPIRVRVVTPKNSHLVRKAKA